MIHVQSISDLTPLGVLELDFLDFSEIDAPAFPNTSSDLNNGNSSIINNNSNNNIGQQPTVVNQNGGLSVQTRSGGVVNNGLKLGGLNLNSNASGNGGAPNLTSGIAVGAMR